MTVYCGKGCGKSWPSDPARSVACPTCQAPPGRPCKRPSGHPIMGKGVHDARDLAADTMGAYGPCPWGQCGAVNQARAKPKPQPAADQAELPFLTATADALA